MIQVDEIIPVWIPDNIPAAPVPAIAVPLPKGFLRFVRFTQAANLGGAAGLISITFLGVGLRSRLFGPGLGGMSIYTDVAAGMRHPPMEMYFREAVHNEELHVLGTGANYGGLLQVGIDLEQKSFGRQVEVYVERSRN